MYLRERATRAKVVAEDGGSRLYRVGLRGALRCNAMQCNAPLYETTLSFHGVARFHRCTDASFIPLVTRVFAGDGDGTRRNEDSGEWKEENGAGGSSRVPWRGVASRRVASRRLGGGRRKVRNRRLKKFYRMRSCRLRCYETQLS